jgi:hypothetical protein
MNDKPTEDDGVRYIRLSEPDHFEYAWYWMGGQVSGQIHLYSTPSHTIPPLVKRQIALAEENMPANLSAEDERWLGEALGEQ